MNIKYFSGTLTKNSLIAASIVIVAPIDFFFSFLKPVNFTSVTTAFQSSLNTWTHYTIACFLFSTRQLFTFPLISLSHSSFGIVSIKLSCASTCQDRHLILFRCASLSGAKFAHIYHSRPSHLMWLQTIRKFKFSTIVVYRPSSGRVKFSAAAAVSLNRLNVLGKFIQQEPV